MQHSACVMHARSFLDEEQHLTCAAVKTDRVIVRHDLASQTYLPGSDLLITFALWHRSF